MSESIQKRDIDKVPCETLEYCPYGWLVEFFPLHGKKVSWGGKDLDIDPIGEEGLSCELFGHDCPVYYAADKFKTSDEEPPEFNNCTHDVKGGKHGGCEECECDRD